MTIAQENNNPLLLQLLYTIPTHIPRDLPGSIFCSAAKKCDCISFSSTESSSKEFYTISFRKQCSSILLSRYFINSKYTTFTTEKSCV